MERLNYFGSKLKNRCDIEIADLDSDASKFFKFVQTNSPRRIR